MSASQHRASGTRRMWFPIRVVGEHSSHSLTASKRLDPAPILRIGRDIEFCASEPQQELNRQFRPEAFDKGGKPHAEALGIGLAGKDMGTRRAG